MRVHTVRQEPAGPEGGGTDRREVHTRQTRLRVAVRGRLGQSIFRYDVTPTAEHIGQAVADAARPARIPFGANYPPAAAVSSTGTGSTSSLVDMVASPWVLRAAVRRTSVRFVTAGGAALAWAHTETRTLVGDRAGARALPFAVLAGDSAAVTAGTDLLPPTAVVPATAYSGGRSWLFGPIALAALLAPACSAAVLGHRPLSAWPSGTRLVTGDDDRLTDLEGTPLRPVTVVDPAGRVAPVCTMAGAGHPDQLTGHGGLHGAALSGMKIAPARVAGGPAAGAAHVVVAARRLAGSTDLHACTVLSAAPGRGASATMVVRLREPLDLLGSGRWVRPAYGGGQEWSSPWWETDDPHRSIAVLHVEEDR